MAVYDKSDIDRRMNGAVESLKGDLGGLRTGRANTSLLDPVVCEVYGAMMPPPENRYMQFLSTTRLVASLRPRQSRPKLTKDNDKPLYAE